MGIKERIKELRKIKRAGSPKNVNAWFNVYQQMCNDCKQKAAVVRPGEGSVTFCEPCAKMIEKEGLAQRL